MAISFFYSLSREKMFTFRIQKITRLTVKTNVKYDKSESRIIRCGNLKSAGWEVGNYEYYSGEYECNLQLGNARHSCKLSSVYRITSHNSRLNQTPTRSLETEGRVYFMEPPPTDFSR